MRLFLHNGIATELWPKRATSDAVREIFTKASERKEFVSVTFRLRCRADAKPITAPFALLVQLENEKKLELQREDIEMCQEILLGNRSDNFIEMGVRGTSLEFLDTFEWHCLLYDVTDLTLPNYSTTR